LSLEGKEDCDSVENLSLKCEHALAKKEISKPIRATYIFEEKQCDDWGRKAC